MTSFFELKMFSVCGRRHLLAALRGEHECNFTFHQYCSAFIFCHLSIQDQSRSVWRFSFTAEFIRDIDANPIRAHTDKHANVHRSCAYVRQRLTSRYAQTTNKENALERHLFNI